MSLIRRVIAQPEAELYRLLASLQHKEFLYEQPAFPESEYIFKHALTQDVAYGTVLQEQRKLLHERTGQTIEQIYQDRLEEHYDALAHHYQRSGNTEKAIEYLQLAGQQAFERSANTEAIHHLTQAVNILQTLPDSRERAQQELELQLVLGPALMTLKGYSAPEVESACTRARFLCQQVGQPAQLFQVLMGQRPFYLVRGDIRTACEIGEQTLQLAQELQDPALLPWGHLAVANPYLSLGELVLARQHAEQAIALSDPRLSRISLSAVTDIEGTSRISAAWVLWMLGYPDQAAGRVSEVVARPAESSNPSMRAWTFAYSAWLHQLRRDVALVSQYAEEGENLSREHNFPLLASVCVILQGWAMAEQGQLEEGVTRLQEGVTAYRTTGAQVWLSLYLAFLGHLYGRLGETRQGLSTLEDALGLAHRLQERCHEAELHRLKGELTLEARGWRLETSPSPQAPSLKPLVPSEVAQEAEACFLKAIAVARQQKAKSWELRAATSLARLWQQQGKKSEARELLAPVYNWFTEGFDTADLQDAQALLITLA